MKKSTIYLIGFLSLTIGSFLSCNHDAFLEETPLSLLAPPSFPSTAKDADLILGGISSRLCHSDFANRSLYMITELSSDETVIRLTSGDRFEIDQFNYTLTNQYVEDVYGVCYQIINQCNLLIKYLPKNEPWAAQYIGSAKFYRAFMYSYLVRLWGSSIIVKEPTEEISNSAVVVRSPEADVFNFIVEDLIDAEKVLPKLWTANPNQTDDGRPTLGAAKILLAEMYLTMAGFPVNDKSKWALAKTKAQEVIDLSVYQLMPNYASNFLIANQNNPEHILSFQFDEANGMTSVQGRPAGTGVKSAGFYFWQAQPSFMSWFDPKDERYLGTFLLTLDGIAYTKFSYNTKYPATPAMTKWQDFGRANIDDNNKRTKLHIPIFRISEAYLIVAEAENELNGATTTAYNAINALRNRAKAPIVPSGSTKDIFRETVQKEWTLELAFEMKRRFNLLRWGTIDKVMGADERAKANYAPYKKYFNIPQSEFDRGLDPSLQTPGY